MTGQEKKTAENFIDLPRTGDYVQATVRIGVERRDFTGVVVKTVKRHSGWYAILENGGEFPIGVHPGMSTELRNYGKTRSA